MSRRATGTGPNVLLVVFDTARADAFEPWGAAPGSTPALQQLAARGVAREQAFATASWTVPSHGSLLGGTSPRRLGVAGGSSGGDPESFRAALAGRRDHLLPTVLGRAGWSTAGISTNLWVSPASGFDTGFDEFTYVEGDRPTALAATDWKSKARWYFEAARARADDGAEEVERTLASWLAARGDDARPFFWFVNLIECHSPYLPPRPWNDLSLTGRLHAGHDARCHQSFAAFCKASLGGTDASQESLQRMRHLYGRSVALLDAWLARLLGALDGAGVLDETLVLVTSDHGENLGEAGLMGHAFSLDDRLIKVPFVAAGPGADAFAGDGAWSLAAVPSSVATAVGLTEHPWAPVGAGVALAHLDAPVEPDNPDAAAVIEQLGLPAEAVDGLLASWTVATDGRWKLRRDDRPDRTGELALVDLASDPLEESWTALDRPALEDERPGALAKLEAALAADTAAATIPEGPATASPAPGTDVDDLARRMELLGYL